MSEPDGRAVAAGVCAGPVADDAATAADVICPLCQQPVIGDAVFGMHPGACVTAAADYAVRGGTKLLQGIEAAWRKEQAA